MGIKQGYGTLTFYNGDQYQGNWNKDKYQGYGEYLSKAGSVYKGQWLAGKYHDQKGTYIWPVENAKKLGIQQYVGKFEKGVK